MKVVIVGAGKVGANLARYLSRGGKEVVLIEADADRCASLDQALDVTVLHGSATDPSVLNEAGLVRADTFVAVTDSDETNLMAVFMASEFLPGHAVKMARLRSRNYAEDRALQRRFNLDVVVNPEVLLGRKILRILSIPGASDVLSFEDGKVDVVAFRAKDSWPIVDHSLRELAREYGHLNLMVGAIMRHVEGGLGRQKVIIPHGETIIKSGDLVYFLTRRECTPNLAKIGVVEGSRGKSVLLAGGAPLAEYLAEVLSNSGYATRIMVPDAQQAHKCAQRLDKAVVLHADPADLNLLTEMIHEGIDTYIAAGANEAINVVTGTLAQKLGVPRSIVITQDSGMMRLFKALGGSIVLNPFDLAASFVLRNVHQVQVLEAKLLAGEDAEALEFVPVPRWPVLGRPLQDAKFPKGSLVAMIVRDGEVIIPRGKDAILPNDRIIVLCKRGSVPALEKFLSSTKKGNG